MQIRRNTKAFKAILEIVSACQDKPDREKLIRLYITKAGNTIKDRISVEGIEGGAELFYDMGYQAVLNNLRSPNHQLYQSDETPGIYYFHSTSNKTWDETPFEFDESIKEDFGSLAEPPATRKKEKVGKFAFPSAKTDKIQPPAKGAKKPQKKTIKIADKGSRQPDFKLKREIEFTRLDDVVFRQPHVTKKEVLEYYDKVSKYILPHLRDRPVVIYRRSTDTKGKELRVAGDLVENGKDPLPKWIQTTRIGRDKEELLLCPDREHLLFYVERGGVTFNATNSFRNSIDTPTCIIIALGGDTDKMKTIDVALAAREILDGLKLPSFVKLDGSSGLHIHIPIQPKPDFETVQEAAEYICKLIRVKAPDLVTLAGTDDKAFRKVSLDYSLNAEGKYVMVPYSLAPDRPSVAMPVAWKDVNQDLEPDMFTHSTILEKLDDTGDPFRSLFKRKVDVKELLENFEERYSFLL